MFLWTSLMSLLWVLSALVQRDIKICVSWLSLFSLFWSVVYDIENQRLYVYLDTSHIFTCLKSVYKNSALSNDLAYSKCIFAYFCIHMFYDHSLDTLDTDVFYNSNHRTAWFLCWSYDILSRQLTCSSSQRWLCISSVRCISSVHFVDLDECFHLLLFYVFKHFFDFNFMYHYLETDFAQTCIR